jgi:hypothetical protein
MSKPFVVLPGLYRLLFLYLEPISTVLPAFLIWFWPGWSWFHQELYPGSSPLGIGSDPAGEVGTKMAIWQLGSCEDFLCVPLSWCLTLRAPGYCLLGMLEGLGLRAVRDALPDNPVSEIGRPIQMRSHRTRPMFVPPGSAGAHCWCDPHGHDHCRCKIRVSGTPIKLTHLQITQ